MIGWLLTALVVSVPGNDVAKAESLYEQARYEAALGALGATCGEAASAMRCEQVRAFVLMALGRETEARAAFERLLLADSEAQLPPDVSPKMLALFDAAHKVVEAARNVRLHKVEVAKAGGAWQLEAGVQGVSLATLTAYVAPTGRDLFQPVEMRAKGTSWVATFEPGFSPEGGVRYYLAAVLDDGTQVFAGSKDGALRLEISIGGEPVVAATDDVLGDRKDERANGEGGGKSGAPGWIAGMPRWGWYAAIGGGAALIASAVLIGIAASGDSGPGSLRVNIEVQP